jgi:hypothetical protein
MTYFVTDIEADGPFPGINAMRCLASIAVSDELEEVGEFSENLEPVAGTRPSPATIAWFERDAPEAWSALQVSPKPAGAVMAAFVHWVEGFPEPRIFVAHPVIFDGRWVDHYLAAHTDKRLFSYAGHADALFVDGGLDLASLAMGALGRSFVDSRRDRLPPELLDGRKHTHLAIDDARGYARLLRNLLLHAVPKG